MRDRPMEQGSTLRYSERPLVTRIDVPGSTIAIVNASPGQFSLSSLRLIGWHLPLIGASKVLAIAELTIG
jgi:hypothetical protein